jgi:hypothetical protein
LWATTATIDNRSGVDGGSDDGGCGDGECKGSSTGNGNSGQRQGNIDNGGATKTTAATAMVVGGNTTIN